METEKFVITDVEPRWTESREITQNPRPPQKTGIEALTAHCRSCQHTWRARSYGEGALRPTIGHVIITCPKCRSEEAVHSGPLLQD